MLALWFKVFESCTKTGIITTTTGVLFMIAEARTTAPIRTAIAIRGLVRASRSAKPVSRSSAPVRTSAPITMNIAAMVQGAGFENTLSAMS